MSKYTAGEWKQGRNSEQVFAGGSIVADCMWIDRPTNECKANASLIAAAPELLEALKSLADHLDYRDAAHYHGSTDIVKRARVVIAKAEGATI